jgi:hypothetical protein
LLFRRGERFILTLAGQFWMVNLARLLLSWNSRAKGRGRTEMSGHPGGRGGMRLSGAAGMGGRA